MTMNTFGNLSSSHLYFFILELEKIFCYCCHFDGYEGSFMRNLGFALRIVEFSNDFFGLYA